LLAFQETTIACNDKTMQIADKSAFLFILIKTCFMDCLFHFVLNKKTHIN